MNNLVSEKMEILPIPKEYYGLMLRILTLNEQIVETNRMLIKDLSSPRIMIKSKKDE